MGAPQLEVITSGNEIDPCSDQAPNDELLSLEQFKRCLPPKAQNSVTIEMVTTINDLIESTPLRESYRDNLLAYTSVLNEGRYSIKQYVNAVRYITFKLMGDTNITAYVKTFAERYQEMLDKNWSSKDIHSTISSYHKTQLITKIFEQSIIPTWILNQEMHQQALNTQAELMQNARSEKVRCDAANSLLTHLKRPEASKVELDVTVREDDSINNLRKVMTEHAEQIRESIKGGFMTADEAARQKIIKGEVVAEQ